MEAVSKHAELCNVTQFELTTNIITKLNTFKLTPTAKLVLLYLTTCYNPKHKEIFPKQKTIADKLGISERSVTRAIQELFEEGLVLIECKYTNRYKFTSRIAQNCPKILSDYKRQNDDLKDDKLSLPYIEQKKVTKKEQRSLNKGGNVYSGDDEILADYAIKHDARNVQAYVNTLKASKSAEKIIKEYKIKNHTEKKALRSIKETQSLIENYVSMKREAVKPTPKWLEFGQKIKALRKA